MKSNKIDFNFNFVSAQNLKLSQTDKLTIEKN